MSTNAPMDRPPACKSTTGRPDTAPTTSVRFPHGFGESWRMWPTRPHPKQRGFPSGVQPALGSCTVRRGCSGPLSWNAGRVAGAAVVRGGLAWASNFATFVWSRSWLCKSLFSRVAVVWSSRATTGRSDAGLTGATSIGSSCRLNFPGTVASQGGEGLFQCGRVALFYQLSCEFVAAQPPGKSADHSDPRFCLLPGRRRQQLPGTGG